MLRWAADTAAGWKECTKKLSAISRQLSVGTEGPARAGLFFCWLSLKLGYIPSVHGFFTVFSAFSRSAPENGRGTWGKVLTTFSKRRGNLFPRRPHHEPCSRDCPLSSLIHTWSCRQETTKPLGRWSTAGSTRLPYWSSNIWKPLLFRYWPRADEFSPRQRQPRQDNDLEAKRRARLRRNGR